MLVKVTVFAGYRNDILHYFLVEKPLSQSQAREFVKSRARDPSALNESDGIVSFGFTGYDKPKSQLLPDSTSVHGNEMRKFPVTKKPKVYVQSELSLILCDVSTCDYATSLRMHGMEAFCSSSH